jgi:hypothetical protein
MLMNKRGGEMATVTRSTAPFLIWREAVIGALVADGVTGEWLREAQQRERLSRAWSSGEPVWMAVDAMRQFWAGVARANREDADGFTHLREAIRRG